MVDRRMMVLGAGLFQASGIKKALALGCRVISVDYLPTNIGHRFSSEYENCSTVDWEAVLSAARRQRIDAITTFASDAAAPTVAAVAADLGLPGPDVRATEVMTDKGRFRRFQHMHGLEAPWSCSVGSFDEAWEETKRVPGRRVFKPVDSSGSRGVSVVDEPELEPCRTAFDRAAEFSRAGRVCVEGFIEGTEVGGDAFLVGGRVVFGITTRKRKTGVVVTGHSLPGILDSRRENGVLSAVERHCELLGYSSGPLNFDAMVCGESVTIIEMSPRTGGNGIPWLIAQHAGVDLEEWCLRWALGEPYLPDLIPLEGRTSCGSWVLIGNRRGKVARLAAMDELKERVPETLELHLAVAIGDEVLPFDQGGSALGCIVFGFDGRNTYEATRRKLGAALALRIET